jgi:hypothetical protein
MNTGRKIINGESVLCPEYICCLPLIVSESPYTVKKIRKQQNGNISGVANGVTDTDPDP